MVDLGEDAMRLARSNVVSATTVAAARSVSP